ncbi:MAG: c-type cytochrome [Bacteroidetes bacterium]|nr:c-type cytochrome [Bacteroidota bacterium]
MKKILTSILLMAMGVNGFSQEDGAKIFRKNCTVCHSLSMDIVGPSLGNISQRLSPEEFYLYTTHPDSSIFTNNSYFKRLRNKYKSRHSSFEFLSKQEVDLIFNFIQSASNASKSGATLPNTLKEKIGFTYLGSINIGSANFKFTIDSIMYVDSFPTEANLILSSSPTLLKKALDKIIEDTHPSKVISESIKLETKYIDATLTDGDPSTKNPTFEIKKIGDAFVRELNDSIALDWKWTITALKANPRSNLFLTVKFYTKRGKIDEDNIVEQSNNKYIIRVVATEIGFFKKVSSFFSNHWEALCSLFFIPMFVYFFNLYRNNKKNKTQLK